MVHQMGCGYYPILFLLRQETFTVYIHMIDQLLIDNLPPHYFQKCVIDSWVLILYISKKGYSCLDLLEMLTKPYDQ